MPLWGTLCIAPLTALPFVLFWVWEGLAKGIFCFFWWAWMSGAGMEATRLSGARQIAPSNLPAVVCSICQGLHCPAPFHQSYHWHSSRLAAFQQLLILFVSLNTVTTDKLLYSEVSKYLKISVVVVVGFVGFKSRHLPIYWPERNLMEKSLSQCQVFNAAAWCSQIISPATWLILISSCLFCSVFCFTCYCK